MINFGFGRLILFLIIPAFLFSSCKKDKNKVAIERDEFIQILVELNIDEGIMTSKGWYDGMMQDSSKSYYNFIFKKYNISRSKFDYSLAYYSKNLEDLSKIYSEVILEMNKRIPKKLNDKSIYQIVYKSLSEGEMNVNPVKRFTEVGIELWMKKNMFNFPGDSAKSDFSFEKEAKHRCLVVLKADYLIMAKDKTKNLKMNLIVFYKDSTSDTLQKVIKKKNGKWENYHLAIKTDSLKTLTKVKSNILITDSITSNTFINIRNISLRQYAPNKDTSKLFEVPKEVKIKAAPPRKIGKPIK